MKEKKGLIILIVILVLLLLTAIGYIVYDKLEENKEPVKEEGEIKEEIEVKETLVAGNTFKLNNVTCQTDEESNCIKEVKVAYNNENHNIKIKQIEGTNLNFKIYVDEVLLDTIDAGSYEEKKDFTEDIAVYVIDSKYLAVLTPRTSEITTAGYALTFYNNGKRVSDEVMIRQHGMTLCSDADCNDVINDSEDLEFDGTTFKFWGQDCSQMKNVKYGVTFNGTTINKNVIETANNAYGSGASC